MNALISNIIGGITNQQVTNESSSSVLLSSIEFSETETIANYSTAGCEEKRLTMLTGKEDIFNGKSKMKNYDQKKNENSYLSINGNSKEKSTEDTIPIPKVQLYTGKIHVEWNHVYKIGAGLHNIGNTCFMNTVIQCLTYCPPLANYLLHDSDHSSKCTVVGFCMMCLLQKHVKRTIGKTGEVIKPLDMYHRLKFIAKHFQFGRQEDAHEFLRYVIDHLWKSCLPQANGLTKLDSASKETTVINRIFGGYHRSQVICLRCKKESNTFDHFMDLILDIKQNVMTLEKALEKFIQPELLQQENCYKCPKCKMKVEAQKRFSVYRAPTVATFQLKRFDYNRSFGGKITKQITYPENLNLRPYMSDTQGDPVWYHLNAVLVHSGPTCNSGHYYCYVKNSNGFWYRMDDAKVYQVSLNQVLSQSAYVLFYIKEEISERTTITKSLDNKSNIMKRSLSNTHFSKLSEVVVLKQIPLGENNSSFSSSKSHGSANGMKNFIVNNQNREKFNMHTNGLLSIPLASPKNKMVSSESISATPGGLVPYIEDSSESSDESESNLSPQIKPNIKTLNSNIMRGTKNGSLDSYQSSPHFEVKRKLSRSVFGTPSHTSSSPKVSATGSWIVTDVPQTISHPPSDTMGSISSTTNWQVIEASDLKQNETHNMSNGKDYNRNDSFQASSTKILESTLSANSVDPADSPSSTPKSKSMRFENHTSAQKWSIQRQIYKTKSSASVDEETGSNNFKRKTNDSYSKVSSKDSSYSHHSESRHSPISKKAKYSENASFLKQENGIRNSTVPVDTSSVQRQSSVLPCDSNSRTRVVNGVSSPEKGGGGSSRNPILLNGFPEMEKKNSLFSKGRQDASFLESNHCEKEKLPIFNQDRSSSLYGTDIPTWREESHYRPSVVSSHQKRKIFDDYDHELDCGKVRKAKTKERYRFFSDKNPFQKQADGFQGKYDGKFFKHHSHRKYDSRPNWKTNKFNGYPRYRNHHRQY